MLCLTSLHAASKIGFCCQAIGDPMMMFQWNLWVAVLSWTKGRRELSGRDNYAGDTFNTFGEGNN